MAKLIFFCGKMAAGKSTLAKELAARERAVVLSQDALVERLFPGEIIDIPSYVKYAGRLNGAIGPHVVALLTRARRSCSISGLHAMRAANRSLKAFAVRQL